VKNKRPKNLNLLTIRLPIPAIASILHRISGFILFLFLPVLLWGLHLSLSSQQSFDDLRHIFLTSCAKFIIWCCLSAFLYHFVAGIRHLLMDIGIGEDLKSGRLSAILALVISALLIILTGVWLW
jgi:succinate dehydrogenase / fumarate reductase cytochrome b subunit